MKPPARTQYITIILIILSDIVNKVLKIGIFLRAPEFLANAVIFMYNHKDMKKKKMKDV